MNCPGRLLAVVGAGLINLASALAQPPSEPFVLINGITVTGSVTAVTDAGVEISSDGKSRTYPFTLLSAGTRYRYDATYRMNLDAYLRGAPSTEITNAPDPQYNPLRPDEPIEAPVAVSAAPVRIDGRLSAGAFALPQAVSRSRFTAWDGRVDAETPMWAFQSGGAADEVTGIAFPVSDSSKIIIAALTGGAPHTVAATMEGEQRMFPMPAIESRMDGLALTTQITWILSPGSTSLLARIDSRIENAAYRFTIRGAVPRMITGDKAMLPRPLFSTPALEFRLQVENEMPYLAGRIRARQFTLVPGEGLPGVVNVMIKQQDGSNVIIENLQHEQDGTYPLRLNISTLEKGKTYRLEASVDLTPLFGRLSYSELFTMP